VRKAARQLSQHLLSHRTTERILSRLAFSFLLSQLLDCIGDITGHPGSQGEEAGDLLEDRDIGGIELSLPIVCDDPNRADLPPLGM
jgi:hypothetical protein